MKNFPACIELLVNMDSRNLHLNMKIENHKVTSGCLNSKFMDIILNLTQKEVISSSCSFNFIESVVVSEKL